MRLSLYSDDQHLCDLSHLTVDFATAKVTFHSPIFDMKRPSLNVRLENGKRYRIENIAKGFSRDNITRDTYNARLIVDDTLKCSRCPHTLSEHSKRKHYPERGVALPECAICDCKNFKD